jgi:hypothetical protein
MARKLLLSVLFLGFFLPAFAQISGGYYWWNSMGQSFLYFQGKNVSGHPLNIKVTCVNEGLKQHSTFTFSNLANGKVFTIGPANGWVWQNGEKLYVSYGNKKVYWICNIVSQTSSSYYPSYTPSYNTNNYSNYYAIEAQIRMYEYKLRDAERSLEMYRHWNEENPSASGTSLIISQQSLIWTYRNCINNLLMQLR